VNSTQSSKKTEEFSLLSDGETAYWN